MTDKAFASVAVTATASSSTYVTSIDAESTFGTNGSGVDQKALEVEVLNSTDRWASSNRERIFANACS